MDQNAPSEVFWEGMWNRGGAPLKPGDFWDVGSVTPILREIDSMGMIPTSGRALVPGCGRGYDMVFFAQKGMSSTGVDISQTAIASCKEYMQTQNIPAPGTAQILEADFFVDNPALGVFDLVLDYTFYCAIPPAMRESWGNRMATLVRPGGKLITIIFPVTEKKLATGPPPHPVNIEQMKSILEKNGFENRYLQPISENTSPVGRKGLEYLGVWERKGAL